MKRYYKLAASAFLMLSTTASQAMACSPSRCRPADTPQNFSLDNRSEAPDATVASDDGQSDLPAEAKQAIRAAATKSRTLPVQPVSAQPAPAPVPASDSPAQASRGPTFNDRLIQIAAAERGLAVQTVMLENKLSELQRWDGMAQEKFQRAFGTTDEATRQQVIKVVATQIARNRQVAAEIANRTNLDFYLQSKR